MTRQTTKPSPSSTTTIAKDLNQLLADSYGLLGQLQLAHWNVEGTDFVALHQMFQEMYEELFLAIDEIAEQVRTLKYYSEGGLKRLAELSNVPEAPSAQSVTAKEFVSAVHAANEVVIKSAIVVRDAAGDDLDPQTEDLMIARISVHNKHAWFFKSYLA